MRLPVFCKKKLYKRHSGCIIQDNRKGNRVLKQELWKSDYIILRKIPFQESSLIVSGLSPAFGRVDFLLKGVRSRHAKKFPYAGLFRVIHVEFHEKQHSSSTLYYLKNHHPLQDFDAIAGNLEHYLAVCDYAAFLLRHTRPMLELPLTFQALLCALSRLCSGKGTLFDLAAAKLVFLYECGFVPEDPSGDSEKTLNALLDYALNRDTPPPDFREEYKKKLTGWIETLAGHMQEN